MFWYCNANAVRHRYWTYGNDLLCLWLRLKAQRERIRKTNYFIGERQHLHLVPVAIRYEFCTRWLYVRSHLQRYSNQVCFIFWRCEKKTAFIRLLILGRQCWLALKSQVFPPAVQARPLQCLRALHIHHIILEIYQWNILPLCIFWRHIIRNSLRERRSIKERSAGAFGGSHLLRGFDVTQDNHSSAFAVLDNS